MRSVARFEKVSYEEFYKAMKAEPHTSVKTDKVIQDVYMDLQLPKRSTVGSAGYDFHSPFQFWLRPGESIKVPTGIRCRIDEGWVLLCFPRSSLGFKYRFWPENLVPVVDSDYYYAKNEGHIMLMMTNNSDKAMEINAGDKFAQGIFLPFGITFDDDATEERIGGFGSTGA